MNQKPPRGHLGGAVRAARLKLKMTQATLGRLIGSGGAFISRIERGSTVNVTVRTLTRLSNVLNVPRSSLLS